MKVVLSGYYGFHNAGDEAILYAMIQALREAEPDIHITVLSNEPEWTAAAYGVEAVNRWNLLEVSQSIHLCDGLISGGGSLIQDKTSDRSVIYYTGVMFLAQKLNKPVVIYAQGIGPLQTKKNKWLTQKAMQQASFISVRDPESKMLLEDIGVTVPIELVPDPVFGIGNVALGSQWLKEHEQSKPIITVSVRHWPSEENLFKNIAGLCDYYGEKGYAVVMLPMHAGVDEEASNAVVQLMKQPAAVAPSDLSLEEKLGLIKASTMVIGMRLHALIFAALAGTPFAAISYDPKIDSFAKLCRQPVIASVLACPSASEMISAIEQQLQEKDAWQEELDTSIKSMNEAARRTAKRAIDVLKNAAR